MLTHHLSLSPTRYHTWQPYLYLVSRQHASNHFLQPCPVGVKLDGYAYAVDSSGDTVCHEGIRAYKHQIPTSDDPCGDREAAIYARLTSGSMSVVSYHLLYGIALILGQLYLLYSF